MFLDYSSRRATLHAGGAAAAVYSSLYFASDAASYEYQGELALQFAAGASISFSHAAIAGAVLDAQAGAGYSCSHGYSSVLPLSITGGAAVQFSPAGEGGQSYEYESLLPLPIAAGVSVSRGWSYVGHIALSFNVGAAVVSPGVIWVPACIVAVIEPDLVAYVEPDFDADVESPLMAYIEDCYE